MTKITASGPQAFWLYPGPIPTTAQSTIEPALLSIVVVVVVVVVVGGGDSFWTKNLLYVFELLLESVRAGKTLMPAALLTGEYALFTNNAWPAVASERSGSGREISSSR